ncbi:O-antigen ligase family protein [Belliella kenyensis]|uniref:O-antigen ligase family protein n=2 Tax=Belliella kenyensis TaxID=1472724 RepID=A0ABV8EM84_9BACT|nr:O-antigen ligase family protein [Belliella kenyensis]MCH7400526.1 O-antigen ligase family protein [Belliella kenyensis]
MFSGAFFPLLVQDQDGVSASESGFLYTIVFLGIYISYLVNFNLNLLIKAILENSLLFGLIVLVSFSFLYSEISVVASKRCLMFFLSSLIALNLGQKLNLLYFLNCSKVALLLITITSLFVIFFLGDIGKMDDTQNMGMHLGAWKGVFIHKNKFGKIMALQALLHGFLYLVYRKRRHLLLILISIICIYFSDSTSAILIALASLAFMFVCTVSLKGENVKLIGLIVLTLSLLLFVFIEVDYIFGLFGKEADLTGRIPLWIILWDFILEKPLLGYGFENFWTNESISHEVWTQMNWNNIYQAHNGFVDVIISAGFLGFVWLIWIILKTFFSAILWLSKHPDLTFLWTASFFFFFIFYNMIESSTIKHNDAFWLFFVVTVSLHNKVKKQKYIHENIAILH